MPCVNPEHLFLGTHGDNMKDMVAKDRHNCGERNPQAKLTVGDVREIRTRRQAGETLQSLADAFGVACSHIGLIVNRKIWTHI